MNLSKTTVLTILLFASLLGNLMLLGMNGGKYVAAHDNKRGESSLSRVMKDMSPESRAQVEEMNKDLQQQLNAKRKVLKQQREKINGLMRNPNVGRPKLEAAYAEYRTTADEVQKLVHAMSINALMALSPEERARVSEAKKPKADDADEMGEKKPKNHSKKQKTTPQP